MAVLTAANGILHARILALDTSTTEPGLTDAQYLSLLNEAYYRWHEVVEPRVTLLSPTASGLTAVAQDSYSKTCTIATVYEPLQLYNVAEAGDTLGGTPMERVEPHYIMSLIKRGLGDHATGVASKWACFRPATATQADIGKWTFLFYPVLSASSHFALMAKVYPTALTSSDTPDVTETAAYTLARIVAVRAATALGRDSEFIGSIAQSIPDDVAASFGISKRVLTPVQRNDERTF